MRKTTVELWDGHKWDYIAPLNRHRGNCLSTVHNNHVYIIGGAGGENNTIEAWCGTTWLEFNIG
jgi:N-acetylneuraminic acid mutarotase